MESAYLVKCRKWGCCTYLSRCAHTASLDSLAPKFVPGLHSLHAFSTNCLVLFLHDWANPWKTGVTGAVCVLDDEPTTSGRNCGQIDPTICQSQKVSFSIAVTIQPESGPVCLLGTEFQKKVCWEILVAGSEQGIEAGQVGLRLITKGDRQTTVAKEWSISATSIADGRWHIVTMTIDADLGTEVWIGVRPPIDIDAFGRSDSEGAESKMHIMDVFMWGRCLTEDEIAAFYGAMGSAEYSMIDFPEDNWQWADSPSRVDEWDSDPAEVDLYDRDDVDWDGQYSSGRKRRSEREGWLLMWILLPEG
ncbi:Calpain-type cysteine protease DEK1 [Vitis vinifera]|uniref:Calpain-type cysteine protease DEK1 n=1 Tax=Vitis vinifera TaxID=29760 RepID=A0A438JVP5_VITVI|nr:Calpain-type cysteine protease DEK1 [Vitis vinifera]